MRHLGLRLAAMAVLLGLMPVALGGCNISCGCTSIPDPNWTPPPVTAQEAQAAVEKFATSSDGLQPGGLTSVLGFAGRDKPIYIVTGPTVGAVVEASGGLVLEFVQADALPESKSVAISSADAQARAATYLSGRGRYTGILLATATLQTGTATSAYVVTWADKAGSQAQISVWVDASSGRPFAFADQRYGLTIAPPTVGKSAAGTLALAAVITPGLEISEADFRFDFAHPYWEITLQSPPVGGITDHMAAIDIDAITGAATVLKSD